MLGTETVTIGGDFTRDDDGRLVASVGLGAVDGCQVQPMSADELVARGRQGTEDAIRVFIPVTTGIDNNSTLIVRGNPYRVDGNPQAYIDPDDPELSGYDITATRAAG
ncbi:hypothetical protein QSJ18_18220 [Gordonia sp. ABSL1-1]|uniref:hypothetical protein n=1 Tax=Gordonia sp. ABSL1-1 TaxID=3053923 RepID=UPI002574794A|nr:hypothetical protein [Gordonia sp. ABSL1-1]MDL9938686.1 hypothetical protein [Gordonia sp. ABSL1-1]